MSQPIGPVFGILGGLTVLPLIARRLRVPAAALEILYGAILFNTLFATVPSWFGFLQELGFIYLMFLAGAELDLRQLRASGLAGTYLLFTGLPFVVLPPLFGWLAGSAYLGVTVAMMSAGIVIPVLKEQQLLDSALGQRVVGLALSGELLSILVLTGLDAYYHYGWTLAALGALLKLAGLFVVAWLALKILYLWAWWQPQKVEHLLESQDPVEEGMRALLCLAVGGAWVAMVAGAEAILGSFLLGMVFTQVFPVKARFEEKMNAIGFGFVIPFFFMGVGSHLQWQQLLEVQTLMLAVGLSLLLGLSNLLVWLGAPMLGLSRGQGAAAACLLSAPLAMVVVAGTLGQRLGVLANEYVAALVLTALLASIVYPTLFRLLPQEKTDKAETHKQQKLL